MSIDPSVSALETALAACVAKLRGELRAEMQESIEREVAARTAALEKGLIDQSAVITALSQRAVEAEENFQRLISAVERLFEQKGIAPAPQPGVSPAAFEEHLNEALHAPVVVPQGFRPRIVSEEEAKHSRHRRPLSRL